MAETPKKRQEGYRGGGVLDAVKENRDVPVVVTKRGKARLFRDGHPMIYSGAIEKVKGNPAPGDAVLVCNGTGEAYAWGLYNAHSMFAVRVMQVESDAAATPGNAMQLRPLLSQRITDALLLRRCMGLPNASTNVYRLINSEGDRLSGLIADVFGDTVVVASSALWVERHRDDITALLQQHGGFSRVLWRPSTDMLKAEGWGVQSLQSTPGTAEHTPTTDTQPLLDADVPAEAEEEAAAAAAAAGAEGGASGQGAGGDLQESLTCTVRENGIQYLVNLSGGQKTGFYADQRDSRAYLGGVVAAAGRVLDLCCYTGGFALSAAVAGAGQVTGVDSSAGALELAQRNAELNGVQDRCTFERADASKYMAAALQAGQQWDVVVLDPPKLAPNRKALPRALHKYRRMNELALRLVARGGLLVTCSCSGAMSQSEGEFLAMLQGAALNVGRRITVLRQAGASGDHPLDPAYPEGKYLTNVTVRVL